MNWEQIEHLRKEGFEVANHTWTHKNAGKLTAPQLIEQLEYIENKITGFGASRPVMPQARLQLAMQRFEYNAWITRDNHKQHTSGALRHSATSFPVTYGAQ